MANFDYVWTYETSRFKISDGAEPDWSFIQELEMRPFTSQGYLLARIILSSFTEIWIFFITILLDAKSVLQDRKHL